MHVQAEGWIDIANKWRKPASVGKGTSCRFGLAFTGRTTPEYEVPEAELTDLLVELYERA
jgi:hypothetical protein